MSNKKRSSKRQLRVPVRFNDHVMENLSQKRNLEEMSSGNRNDDEILDKSMLSNEESGLEKVKIVDENRDSRLNDADGVCDKDVLVNGGIMNGDDGIEADNVDKEDVVSKVQLNNGIKCELLNSGTDNETHVEDVVKEVNDNNQVNLNSYANKLNTSLDNEENKLFLSQLAQIRNVKKMPVYELKYNIRMMWGRLGLKDIVVDTDEMCFFKFKSEEEMNNVLDQSPGLVNGKPLIVQKWDSEITIVKEAPCKIPLWIRIFNVLLEAWSVKEISTIASRLGRPIKMDKMTADMCMEGSGRLGYVRVLVEVDARKEYVDKVEIDYVDNQMNVKRTKWIIRGNNNEEFVEVKNRKNKWRNNDNFNKRVQGNNIPARRDNVTANVKYAFKLKEPVHKPVETPAKENPKSGGTASNRKIRSDKAWRISNENDKELIKSANKYAVLSDDENGSNGEEEFTYKRLIVDEFIRKKLQPTCTETKNWTYDMVNYFKYQWEAMERKAKNGEVDSDDEDVYENKNEAIQNIIPNEGMCNELKQKEVRKFILDDSIQVQLHTSKRIFNSHPWIVMGDYNVTAKPEEQSNGASVLTSDMRDLKDAINALEIEDIYSSGFFYTWTKSLKNPLNSTLMKLDRIMGNDAYLSLIELMVFFFLMWYLTTALVVKKLKNLKKPLNELNWKNGNLYDNVLEAVKLLNKYNKSAEDELKLLHQITKVKWLKEGDRNSAYFHSILKARRHKKRMETICGEDGVRYNGSNVADQFVNHFKNFLGESIPVKPLSSLSGIVLLKLCEEDATGIIERCLCISIILTNRIENGLCKVVSLNQSAFIPGRHIQDNILITQELFKGYKRKNGIKRCEFLLFQGGKRAEGKEIILPLLVYSCNGGFQYDLQYDLGQRNQRIREIQISLWVQRNATYTDVINEGLKRDLLTVLPFKCGTLPMKYLGVPLVAKRHGVNDCKSLIENVEKWISSWRNRLLPYAGRIQLIASVLSSMQQYWASDYMIPSSVFKDLNKLLKRFLWNAGDSTKGNASCMEFSLSGPLSNQIPKRAIFKASLAQISTPTFSDCKDSVKWLNAENKEVDFSTHVAWLSLREMEIQGKLLTKDRIMMWQNGDDLKCPLCKSVADSHIHLFFDCPFFLGVWKRIQTKSSSCRSGHNMNNIVTIIHQFVDRLILSAFVYYIWNERNKRMFQKCSRTEEDLVGCIENNVGYMLKCLKVKKSSAILTVAKRWGLKWDKGYLLAEIK
ncbi:RNA-directed DNA polymerase, eukaryota, reverse transcriptase zinc-binding domain protein [Tanacetum coccineum]